MVCVFCDTNSHCCEAPATWVGQSVGCDYRSQNLKTLHFHDHHCENLKSCMLCLVFQYRSTQVVRVTGIVNYIPLDWISRSSVPPGNLLENEFCMQWVAYHIWLVTWCILPISWCLTQHFSTFSVCRFTEMQFIILPSHVLFFSYMQVLQLLSSLHFLCLKACSLYSQEFATVLYLEPD
jgi:hypothetical protein